ncbi:unnamed protein product [Closterium sp. NIES-65]|nr:unnamed protein product [Closterium sp. NIES-65]
MLWEEGRRKEFEGGASSTAACLNLSPSTPPPSFLSARRALPLFLIAGGVAHNIAECMAALSAAPFLISAVGDDAAGRSHYCRQVALLQAGRTAAGRSHCCRQVALLQAGRTAAGRLQCCSALLPMPLPSSSLAPLQPATVQPPPSLTAL